MSVTHFETEAEAKCELVGEAGFARDIVMPSSEPVSRKRRLFADAEREEWVR